MIPDEQIRAIALEQAREMEGIHIEQHLPEFLAKCLAAINAKAKPVAWMDQNGISFICAATKDAAHLDMYCYHDIPLFIHPAIEPAPQQRDELLAALDTVLDAVGALTKRYELQGYGLSEDEIPEELK